MQEIDRDHGHARVEIYSGVKGRGKMELRLHETNTFCETE